MFYHDVLPRVAKPCQRCHGAQQEISRAARRPRSHAQGWAELSGAAVRVVGLRRRLPGLERRVSLGKPGGQVGELHRIYGKQM